MVDQKGELDKQFKMAQKNCDLICRMWCKETKVHVTVGFDRASSTTK